MTFLPELLAPVGNREKLETAIRYGADAVYLGGPIMNLRAKSAAFDWDDLCEGIAYAHQHDVSAYMCLNALPREQDLKKVDEALEHISGMDDASRPDALIIADPGVLAKTRKLLPDMPIHLSTQANTANSSSAAFWQDFGVSRVNLARELDLQAILNIRRALPDLELEVFCHGAMCMAVSGRCVMSAHMNNRSANLGLCTHPCRFDYQVKAIAIEEKTRPGTLAWEVYEEDGYSSILAAEDLCLIKFLPWFMENGVHAIKIEGRMKSGGYLAQVVDSYATGLRALKAGAFKADEHLGELLNTASRPLTSGFFLPEGKRVTYPAAEVQHPIVGRILAQTGDESWQVAVRTRFDCSKPLCILVPGLERPVMASTEYSFENPQGERRDTIHSGTTLTLRASHPALSEGLFLREAAE